MANIEEIKNKLTEITDNIKQHQSDIKALQKNQNLTAWFAVNFKTHNNILKEFGMPVADLLAAKKSCLELPKKIAKRVGPLTNEVGNLKVDLETSPSESLNARLKKIHGHYQLMAKDVNLFMSQADLLIKAKESFFTKIHINNFFSLTKNALKSKKGMFDKGMILFNFVFVEKDEEQNPHTLESFIADCDKLELRLRGLKVPALPSLADEVLHHQIDLTVATLNNLSAYLVKTKTELASEIATRNLIKNKLTEIHEEKSIILVIDKCKQLTFSVSELFLGLAAHQKIISNISIIAEAIEQIGVFHLSLKNTLLKQLDAHISQAGEKLNPPTFAAQYTKDFFFGLKGVIRSLKLIYSTFKGKEAINELELQLILEQSISNCRIFYGNSKNDIKKLQTFIDNLLKKYDRPFPYQQLFKLLKKTISGYGTAVEKFILNHAIESKYQSSKGDIIPATFGKLIKKIEAKNQLFIKSLK